MTAWKTLDLRQRKTCGPHDGELIVLHMIPKSTWGTERYLVSRLQTEAGCTWIKSNGNVLSPANLEKHYDLRWLRLPEDTIREEGGYAEAPQKGRAVRHHLGGFIV